jgi:hypothetical protein
MILPGSFSKDWIEQFRQIKEFSKINPPIAVKVKTGNNEAPEFYDKSKNINDY